MSTGVKDGIFLNRKMADAAGNCPWKIWVFFLPQSWILKYIF